MSLSLSGEDLFDLKSDYLNGVKANLKSLSQLTAVLHASCPARQDLQPLIHPTLYEGAAEGTRQFASALLGEVFNSAFSGLFKPLTFQSCSALPASPSYVQRLKLAPLVPLTIPGS